MPNTHESLGALKGPLLKVAQLLSTIPNALPAEYASELSQKLQSQAPPMGWLSRAPPDERELGPDWEKKFKSFEKTAGGRGLARPGA